jgi:hypothetical protein
MSRKDFNRIRNYKGKVLVSSMGIILVAFYLSIYIYPSIHLSIYSSPVYHFI